MMRKWLTFMCGMVCGMSLLGVMGIALAGDLLPPGGPDDPASAMYTIQAIWQRLTDGSPGTKRGAGFQDPTAGPGSTMPTLNEVMGACPARDDTNGASAGDVRTGKTYWGLTTSGWGAKTGTGTRTLSAASVSVSEGYYEATTLTAVESDLTAANIVSGVELFGVAGTAASGGGTYASPVPKTGQSTIYTAGDDGDLEPGVAWPDPRFTDNGDGTVTDNLTGLMWLKDANSGGSKGWNDAIDYCNNLTTAGHSDWRLPSRFELESLLDLGRYNPALPSGHPFTNVQSDVYWSGSTDANSTGHAWSVYLNYGNVYDGNKTSANYVWPVRSGQ